MVKHRWSAAWREAWRLRAPGISAEGRLIRQLELVLVHRMNRILLPLFGATQNAMQDFLSVVHRFCTAPAALEKIAFRKACGEFSREQQFRSGELTTSPWERAVTLKKQAGHAGGGLPG